MTDRTTLDDTSLDPPDLSRPVPGLVVVASGGAPTLRPLPVDGSLLLGRDDISGALFDERMSREHAEVIRNERGWTVRDLGSRNGTFVDGARVTGTLTLATPRVLRAGSTLCLFADDVSRFDRVAIAGDGPIAGPLMQRRLEQIATAARAGQRLLLRGESGSGKELAARHFHAHGPHAQGRFVAINCAAIPEGVAERLLFGAIKGAYSGAVANAEGYVQSADGGVLFLDEVAELDLDVQAKLLRFLEGGEVIPLGAATPRKVNASVCFATHEDLRAAVAARRFREDLYYRVAESEVELPPLRERPEEIPYHIARAVRALGDGAAAHVRFVEECLLRPWPGNVRELNAALRAAVERARDSGVATVRAEHLDARAGLAMMPPTTTAPPTAATKPTELLTEEDARLRERLVELLGLHRGNVSAVARAMGKARMQVQRWLARFALDAARYR